ncbi:MAG: hypothetical protein AAFV72_26725, partial [Cyanobacteria bacterium J06635_1]
MVRGEDREGRGGRGWQCDIAQVRALAASTDVVEFMAARLQRLSPQTQTILKLAACIGNQFDLATLAIVYEQTQPETATQLWQSLQEGLILPQSEVYKFYLEPTSQESGDRSQEIGDRSQEIGDRSQESVKAGSTTPPPHHLTIPLYKFLHDRVQQAAYTLIPDTEKLFSIWDKGV